MIRRSVQRVVAHFRGLAPGQRSSAKTSQRWQVVGDTVSDLTCPRIEPETSRSDIDVFTTAKTCRNNGRNSKSEFACTNAFDTFLR